MTVKQKYFWSDGYERGKSMAMEVAVPAADQEVEMLDGTDIIDCTGAAWDYMTNYAHIIENNDRQFSPFEFTARDLREYGRWMDAHGYDDQAGWDAFEKGIQEGIKDTVSWKLAWYIDEDFDTAREA